MDRLVRPADSVQRVSRKLARTSHKNTFPLHEMQLNILLISFLTAPSPSTTPNTTYTDTVSVKLSLQSFFKVLLSQIVNVADQHKHG